MLSSNKKLFIIAFFLPILNCGYTLNHRLKTGFDDSRGIFVPVFDNSSTEPGAEIVFTNALIRELASRGNVVLSSREKGGLELKGNLSSLTINPTVNSTADVKGLFYHTLIPTELGITASLSLTLTDPETERTLWSRTFRGYRRVSTTTDRTFNYQVPSSLALINSSLAESQFPLIARQIMQDVYDELVDH